jgi:hypothetical protein
VINASAHLNAYAFGFQKINMSPNLFPAKYKTELGFLTKKVCDIVYWCPSSSPTSESAADELAPAAAMTKTFFEGVLRCRLIPGEGEYVVVDMLPRVKTWGKMCQDCSNKAQRPIYHLRDQTKCSLSFHPPSKRGIVHPDPNRLGGVQRDRAWKKQSAKAQGTHPCRNIDCPHKSYNSVHHSNKHMMAKHDIPAGDPRLYPLPAKKKTKRRKKKAKSLASPKPKPKKPPRRKRRGQIVAMLSSSDDADSADPTDESELQS